MSKGKISRSNFEGGTDGKNKKNKPFVLVCIGAGLSGWPQRIESRPGTVWIPSISGVKTDVLITGPFEK